MPISWTEATEAAVRRHVAATGDAVFSRRSLIDAELAQIVAETGSAGTIPEMTLSRELQEMRDRGVIAFVEPGIYRWLGDVGVVTALGIGKGVFVIGSDSIYKDEPERFYRFPPQWLANAAKVVGDWIVYQEPMRAGKRGYYAVAKVEKIVPIRRPKACISR